jgi:hypothetical protein
MRSRKEENRYRKKESELTRHERDHLRSWTKATPSQRLAWLEEAKQIALKSKAIK